MLVDDHDIVRTGLKSFLEIQEGFQVVAEASGGLEAIELAGEARPDVIIMDISMPDMDGMEATRRLKALYPACNILALTVHGDKQYVFEALAAGASGYVTKNASPEDLVDAVRSVAAGNVYLQPALARWVLEDYRRLLVQSAADRHTPAGEPPAEKSPVDLSKRELQVLESVAQGLTNAQIGERLGISPKTVARHRERIMDKLNLHSRTALVKFAIRTRLIDVD
jgi:two-component system response regulator NreC